MSKHAVTWGAAPTVPFLAIEQLVMGSDAKAALKAGNERLFKTRSAQSCPVSCSGGDYGIWREDYAFGPEGGSTSQAGQTSTSPVGVCC